MTGIYYIVGETSSKIHLFPSRTLYNRSQLLIPRCFSRLLTMLRFEKSRKKEIYYSRMICFSHFRVSDISTIQVYCTIDESERFLIIIAYVLYMHQHFFYNICINIYIICKYLCVSASTCVIDIFQRYLNARPITHASDVKLGEYLFCVYIRIVKISI